MPRIFDNIENHLLPILLQTLELSNRADFCVGFFNLRGWRLLDSPINEWEGTEENRCRLLVGMQKLPYEELKEALYKKADDEGIDNKTANILRRQCAQQFKDQLIIGIPTNADEAGLRRLSKQLKAGKVVVKLHLSFPLHAKLYLLHRKDPNNPCMGILGSSNLTMSGLDKQGELNVDVLEHDACNKLQKWFDDRWNDRLCIDISADLADIIDNSWAREDIIPPYYIYLKMAYHLSQEARAGLSEFKIPKDFRNDLLPFQQAAVLIAAKKLNVRNGVFIGDVVGLGKTITASALAKIYEEEFYFSTLIISPPNLKEMWNHYKNKYDLKAEIISSGEVQKKLPKLKRFRIVIIDESHNLRNDQGSRYRAIKEYLEDNESKVILLSATPYNKDYTDLSNQLRLFIPDDMDLGISPEAYINHLGGYVQFAARHTDTFIRSIKAFERSHFTDDWRELMRLFMVRRTRSFIKANYAVTDETEGRRYLTFSDGTRSYFPDRTAKKLEYEFNKDDPNDQYAKLYTEAVVTAISSLDLPRYGLALYLKPNPTIIPNEKEKVMLDNLSRAGKRLIGFCRTNLFKRLESSGYSFLLSLSRHILRNYIFIYALQNGMELPIGKNFSENLDAFLDDDDLDFIEADNVTISFLDDREKYLQKGKAAYEAFKQPHLAKRYSWIRSAFFTNEMMQNLIKDSDSLLDILSANTTWNPDIDRQLNGLHKLITETHSDDKVLIFTQFADTADYLHKQLCNRKVDALSVATGNSENPTATARLFSPHSNEMGSINNELRVLIATDVLSEGQNLQDCHVIVNYDLPWAIIRLIQRAGRVDRIGQQAKEILCYSVLPEEGIEQIINLRNRLSNRIKQNAEVVGSDEVFFEGDPINLKDLYNENSGVLDDEKEAEVDLSSYAFQIWKNAVDANRQLQKIIPDLPNVSFSTKSIVGEGTHPGAIVYVKTAHDNDILAWINNTGHVISQSQLNILKTAECLPDTVALSRAENHHDLVKSGVDYIRNEEKNLGGTLGRRTSVKYRVYIRMDSFCKNNQIDIFVTDTLKKAIDSIYKYPLKEMAKDLLNRNLKSGISDEELSQLLVTLYEENKLCIDPEDGPVLDEPQIICSMGLRKE